MKDSGISWVGEIPKEWRCLPIRALFTENRNKNFLGRETKALQFKYGTIVPKKNFDPEENYVAETILNYNIVDRGMIMLNGLNLNFDFVSKRIALVAERGIITSAYTSFYPTDTTIVLSEYANYLLKSYDNCAAFHNMGGGVRKILNFDELKRQYFVLPALDEQQRIAEFLDRECGKIDGLKADIQAQIDTLEQYKRSVITEAVTHGLNPSAPMKDSGILWVGKTPEYWKVGRIGGLYELRNQKVSDKDFMPLSVTMKGVLPQLETAAKTNDGDNRKLVRVGDFAINSRSDRRGSCGISDYDGSVSLINTILKPRNRMNAKYYNWLFHTPMFADEFYKWGHGIVDDLWTTNWSEMKRISIPLPPLDEQQEIADYLDNKCAEIEQIIADKKTQIETLDGYKKSLIYEYVTGKKEVL
ncbi:MAG: restriction endonuclease subunit S [Firmicutes bacterium]|nr:restriction endonuclease subunit S [Bacillota bacterium]